MEKNNDVLFYTCSLIEYISRQTKNNPEDVVIFLGDDLERIYNFSDVFHGEVIETVSYDFITRNNISQGDFDNISRCIYEIPNYWDIGEVFERLIEDNYDEGDVFKGIREVYSSWICDEILNFNSDLYYQSREYLTQCFRECEILF